MNDDSETIIEKTYQMQSGDWQPLIDAMRFLKHNPMCGDVASRLELMFTAAQKGKYYYIEMGVEDQKEGCTIIGMDFDGCPETPAP